MRALRNVVLAIGTFALLTTVAANTLDRPSKTTRTLNYLEANGDRYEIVFLGPSYVEQQIIPSVFDAELAARGYPMRSFNAGMPAMGGPEQRELAQRILAMDLPRLRFLLFDQTLGAVPRTGKNFYTARVIEWHTWRTLIHMARRDLLGDVRRRDHLLNALARGTAFGLGAARLAEPDPLARVMLEGPPSYWTSAEGRPLRTATLSKKQAHELRKNIAPCVAAALEPVGPPPLALETLALLDGTGVEAAFIVAPVNRCIPPIENREPFRPITTLAFGPDRYPTLYERQHRVSTNHLNYRGSVLYSQALAARFADTLDRAAERAAEPEGD